MAMKKLFLGVITTAALCLSSAAFAHAHLKSAIPAVNGKTAKAPSDLSLTFSEALNIKFSGVKVMTTKHKLIHLGKTRLAKSNDKEMLVTLPEPLKAGKYTVQWHALSKDGHKTKGTYTFTVTK